MFLDRAIKYPFAEKLSKGIIIVITILVYFIGVSMVAPYTNEITYKEGKCKEGWHDYKDSLIYVIILGLVQEFIPLLILIVTHIAMFYHLWKKNSGMQNQNSKQQQLAQLRMMKIQKTFIVIVIVFFILTLPYSISFIVTPISSQL